ncbi:MAG: hypothetical protein ABI831_12765 [Betaproteobacteria bacterium]
MLSPTMGKRKFNQAAGFVLIEVLLSILILSLGIIGLVSLQAVAAKQSTDAKYRSEAALLANQLLGQMWVTDRTATTLATFNTGQAGYTAWLSKVTAVLPGVGTSAPQVTVDAAGMVTVEVHWVAPGDSLTHTFTAIAQIR